MRISPEFLFAVLPWMTSYLCQRAMKSNVMRVYSLYPWGGGEERYCFLCCICTEASVKIQFNCLFRFVSTARMPQNAYALCQCTSFLNNYILTFAVFYERLDTLYCTNAMTPRQLNGSIYLVKTNSNASSGKIFLWLCKTY